MSEASHDLQKRVGEPLALGRILILTEYFPPEPGAPQIRLAALARELKRNGIEAEVPTGMPSYRLGQVFEGYRGTVTLRAEVDRIPPCVVSGCILLPVAR